MKSLLLVICIPVLFALAGGEGKKNKSEVEAPGKRYRPIILDENFEHTKWGIEPSDLIFHFAAYTTSFDSDDDNNGDGKADVWGIPEWVAFEIKTKPEEMPKYKRPSPWLTHDSLFNIGKAPNDDTYKVSGANDMKVVKGNNRFVRGHMCPKNAADRIGENAGYNTHTVLNAVPQLQWQNNGIWKYLEKDCTDWADKYERIWVVAGPAFFKQNPSMNLGQAGEVPAAIPDAIYKIVIREDPDSESGVTTMAFLFPNIIASNKKIAAHFLTTVEDIENVTKLKFLTNLEEAARKKELTRNNDLSDEEKTVIYNAW